MTFSRARARPSGAAMCLLMATLLMPGRASADLNVQIIGLYGAERRNVEARLSILAYAESDGEDEAQIRRLHRAAQDDIRGALQAFGYYSPFIRSSLQTDDSDWIARYEIESGPPTLLGRVRIEITGEGQDFPDLAKVKAQSPLREGARLLHAEYEETKAELARTAYRNGFLDAVYSAHRLEIDVARRRADVLLRLDTGPRYFFGEVRVEQDGLSDEFLARYIPISPGHPFEPQKLLDAQFALGDLGYFSTVDVQTMRAEAVDNRIPVVITTTPRPPQRYDIGVGYGTDTGARLTLGAEFRRLTETGHKLRTDLRVSEVKNSVTGDYRIPLGNEAGETLGFGSGYTDEKIADGVSRRYEIGVYVDRRPGDWQRRIYLNFQNETSIIPATGTDSVDLLIPGLSFSRGDTDDPIHARLGWHVFVDVHGAYREMLSDTTFIQGRTVMRAVVPLGERARLLGRAELGGSIVEEFSELPASQRFFAGGDQSVRGYAYQSLGPRDANGTAIGGEFLNAYSVEAEMRVWGSWGAAVFWDAGNADDAPWMDLFQGIGAGVRYRAPIGTLQLDLAHPLQGDERGIRPHLGIRVGL